MLEGGHLSHLATSESISLSFRRPSQHLEQVWPARLCFSSQGNCSPLQCRFVKAAVHFPQERNLLSSSQHNQQCSVYSLWGQMGGGGVVHHEYLLGSMHEEWFVDRHIQVRLKKVDVVWAVVGDDNTHSQADLLELINGLGKKVRHCQGRHRSTRKEVAEWLFLLLNNPPHYEHDSMVC